MPSESRFLSRIALAACLILSPGLHAATVSGLFTASAEVMDQSVEQRNQGLRRALADVLVRLTGDRSIHEWNDTEALLTQAPEMVQRYSFEKLPPPEAANAPADAQPDATPELAPPEPPAFRLHAVFDGRAVERAARNNGLPIWGSSRPRHLVWLALEDGSRGRALVDQDSAAERAAPVLEAARARGLPLTWPLQDLEDRRNLDFADVWGGFSDRILNASARYDAPQVVTAAIGREGGLWVSRWTLLNPDGPVDSWVVTELDPAQAMSEGLHVLADRQAARLAFRSDGYVQALNLRVHGIASLYDYGRVLNHLGGLNAVDDVQVLEVTPDRVTYRLRVEGDREALSNAIALGRLLQPQPGGQSFGMPTDEIRDLEYRLVR